jgi:hypothetical protein
MLNQECKSCPPGKSSVYGKSECDECTLGKFSNDEQTSCDLCGAGKHGNPDTALANRLTADVACTACPVATYSSARGVANATDCTSCPPGKALNETGKTKSSSCIQCKGNTVAKVSGSTQCSEVEKGTIVISGGAAVVSKYLSSLYSFYFCFHNFTQRLFTHITITINVSLFLYTTTKIFQRSPKAPTLPTAKKTIVIRFLRVRQVQWALDHHQLNAKHAKQEKLVLRVLSLVLRAKLGNFHKRQAHRAALRVI